MRQDRDIGGLCHWLLHRSCDACNAMAAVVHHLAAWFVSDDEEELGNASTCGNNGVSWQSARSAADYVDLGNRLEAEAEEEDALRAYAEAIRLDPSCGMAHHCIGDIYYRRDAVTQAQPYLQRAVQ
eukprot:5241298-Amphidinium_carterae.1